MVRTPKFCGRCGRPLTVTQSTLGYDVYDGTPVTQQYATCNVQEVNTGRFGVARSRYVTHQSWLLNADGSWEQVN